MDPTTAQPSDISGSDHYLYAAVYSTKGGLSSTLGLNNTLNHDVSARVTLFNKHGQALTTPAMNITLGPHKNHGFNVADWIANHGGFDEGSLVVFYHGLSMSLGAQEIVTDAARGLNFDVHLSEYDNFKSSRVEGLWWALGHQSEAQVFIANTEESPTRVTPVFYVRGTEYQGEPIDLAGHETDSIDIEKALKKLHVSGDISVGGISLSYTNGPGAIAVVGVVSNKHTGFSTTMRFIDRTTQKTTALHGANLPIGKSQADSGFPLHARFTPHVIVRNNTSQPVQINPRIRYTLYGQPNVISLASVSLPANQVRELNLNSAINAIGNNPVADTGVEIDHSGQPGAVMAYAAGVDQNDGNSFDVPIKDPKNMPFQGGSYPWNIEGDNRAVLHIKSIDAPNDGQKREFMVKLYFDGGEYNLPLQQVEAGQTGQVDIRKLRDDQVKDVLGNVIPPNVTGGQLAWYGRANKGEFIGRLAAYNPVAGTSSSFSCPQACLCLPTYLLGDARPNSIADFKNAEFPLDALETDGDCNGANQFTYGVPDVQFFSSNTDVVTISGHTATLVDAGDAEITASWDGYTIEQQCTLASDGECIDARCPAYAVLAPNDHIAVDVDTLKVIVPNPPVTESNDSPGVIAGQSFTFVVQAINSNGDIDLSKSGTVSVVASRTLDSTETGPSSTITLSGGQYSASAILNRVSGTDRGTTFQFTPTGGGHFNLFVYTYFSVTASLEGLFGNTTACGHVISSTDHFVALPSTGLCNQGVVVRNSSGTAIDETSVKDVGPFFPNTPGPNNSNTCNGGNDTYWNSGGVPRATHDSCSSSGAGIDLASGTASTVGISGLGTVRWRFD